ncbi:protein BTG2 isoform X1 [Centroberyx affinis]|uniref:protein BTG2 isoform X1 n=1 Tax=Centroberyx affinis TaxID=166261 RepID=UPI003A5BC104
MNQGYGSRTEMMPEVTAAATFVSRLLRTRGCLNEQQLQVFRDCLQQSLSEHYQHHWFPDRPQKGSGYRCIRINHEMDPLIGRAAGRIGLTPDQLFGLLPRELTLWVDPYEVSYRIGEDGSICVLYETEAPSTPSPAASPVSLAESPYNNTLNCKNGFLMSGRRSPPKNYLMTVSS